MNIHEYQAKEILKRFKVRVPEGRLVDEGADLEARAERAAQDLAKERGNGVWVAGRSSDWRVADDCCR